MGAKINDDLLVWFLYIPPPSFFGGHFKKKKSFLVRSGDFRNYSVKDWQAEAGNGLGWMLTSFRHARHRVGNPTAVHPVNIPGIPGVSSALNPTSVTGVYQPLLRDLQTWPGGAWGKGC
jgi:hypothetical protein